MTARDRRRDGLAENVADFGVRVLQDALTEATAAYWLRRGATFEAAMPGGYRYPADVRRHGLDCRPGCTRCPAVHERGEVKVDYLGRATPEQLEERRAGLALTVAACRQRASVAQLTWESASVPDVVQAMREAS